MTSPLATTLMNSEDHLAKQMWGGLARVGEAPRSRAFGDDVDMNDPSARAAYRTRQSVMPEFGRSGTGVELPAPVTQGRPSPITRAIGLLGNRIVPPMTAEEADRIKQWRTGLQNFVLGRALGILGLPGDMNISAANGMKAAGEATGWEFPKMVGRAMQVLNPFPGVEVINGTIQQSLPGIAARLNEANIPTASAQRRRYRHE